jgi:hypothetical protein
MENEIIISNILNKFNGIKKTIPSKDLFEKIERKIKIEEKNLTILWYLVASIFVIISLNIIFLFSIPINKNYETSSLDIIINKNNQIY